MQSHSLHRNLVVGKTCRWAYVDWARLKENALFASEITGVQISKGEKFEILNSLTSIFTVWFGPAKIEYSSSWPKQDSKVQRP